MTEPFMGQIIQGGWSFAPSNYAFCRGQIMSISQNSALFSLLGTTFGGDGQTTFALPNLGGRTMVGTGQLLGGGNYQLGQIAGTENTTLLLGNMPQHTHAATFTPSGSGTFNTSDAKATAQTPIAGGTFGKTVDSSGAAIPLIYIAAGSGNTIALAGLNAAGTVTNALAGNSLPFPNMQPYLGITMVIALNGIFPSRN